MIKLSDKFQLITASFFKETLRICTVLVMARLIPPAANGAYLLVVAAGGLIMSFGDFAVPQSFVQINDVSEELLIDTAMIFINTLYAIYGIFAIGASIYLTHKYSDPRLWKLGIIFAASNQLGAVYAVPLATLNRRLQFSAESRQNIVFSLAAATAGITFALLNWGVYAIVFQSLVGLLAANIAICMKVPLRMPKSFSWPLLRKFFWLGGPVSLSTYVSSVEGSIVSLVINSFAGQYGLGLWGKALQIQMLFGVNLMVSFQRVVYPLLCRAVAQPERIKALFRRTSVTMMLVSAYFTAFLFCCAGPMVKVVLGPLWWGTIPLLQICSIAIPALAIGMVGLMIAMATGDNRPVLKMSVLNICLFLPAVFLCKRWGLVGLACCWVVSRYLMSTTLLQSVSRRIGTGLMDVKSEMIRIFIAAAISALITFQVNRLVAPHVNLFILLCVGGATMGLAYLSIISIILRGGLMDALRLMRKAPNAPPPPAERGFESPSVNEPSYVLSAMGGMDASALAPRTDSTTD